jgi:hypothetical protein
MRLRALALTGGLFLVLLPAAALAQSAGDEQYSDPFGGDNAPAAKSPSNPSSGSSPSSDTQHAGTTSSSGDGTSSSQDPNSSSSSSSGELPRTGLRVWMLALMGGLMMLSGILLRLGLRPLTQRAGGGSPATLGRDIRLIRPARR